MEKSDNRSKQGKIHAHRLALTDTERPSHRPNTRNSPMKTNHKKRELEQEVTTDVPAKRLKTDGSKKVGRWVTKGPGDDHREAVGVLKSPNYSKQSKSSKLSEPSKSSKLESKKRKHLDEQEMAAENSRQSKRIKTDSATPK